MTSSLIFVLLFGVWAAYMLQHWVRRREDLATAQSVDRFSEGMHLLERPDSQVVADDEHARGTILRPAPVRAASTSEVAHAMDEVETPHEGATAMGALVGRAKSIQTSGRGLTPQMKTAALLGALGFFVVTLVGALASFLPVWMPVLGLFATGGVVVWLRRTATQRKAVAPVAPKRVVVAAPKQEVKATPVRTVPVVAPVVESAPVVVTESVDEVVAAPVTPSSAEAEVFDQGWAPVAVPRPTYTMKAKAEREEVLPARTVDDAPLAARYEHASIDELPFDGMALDEDYEELPRVYRAS